MACQLGDHNSAADMPREPHGQSAKGARPAWLRDRACAVDKPTKNDRA